MRAGWPLDDVFVGEGVAFDEVGLHPIAGRERRARAGRDHRDSASCRRDRAAAGGCARRAARRVVRPRADRRVRPRQPRHDRSAPLRPRARMGSWCAVASTCSTRSACAHRPVQLFFVPITRADDAAAVLDELGRWGMQRLGTSADRGAALRRRRPPRPRRARRSAARHTGSPPTWSAVRRPHGVDPDRGPRRVAQRGGRRGGAVLRGRPPAEVPVNRARVRAALCFTCAR